MSIEIELPPIAGPFIQSLRSVGYSLDSAVADIVDNSISARASEIHIDTGWNRGNPFLVIADNGSGMNPEECQAAMQLGAVGPASQRDESDLGRFGMGLKTASFSQCKHLSIISRQSVNASWYGLKWDLDLVEKTNSWKVIVLDEAEISRTINDSSSDLEVGTYVYWDKFDAVLDDTAADASTDYERHIDGLINHLSLVYHRYIQGDDVPAKISLYLNNVKIGARDPFALNPPKGKPGAILTVDEYAVLRTDDSESKVKIKSYVLPHPSNIDQEFMRKVSGDDDYYSGQGIYIYRGGRLISHSGWLRLARLSETNKLARVRVDFNNDADRLWRIDVKKSKIEIPASLRAKIRSVIAQTTGKSSRSFNKRAELPSYDASPVWQRYFDQETKTIQYLIDKDHPLVSQLLSESSKATRTLISLFESSLPVQLIKNDIGADKVRFFNEDGIPEPLIKLARKLIASDFSRQDIEDLLKGDSNFNLSDGQIKKIVDKAEREASE